MRRWIWSTRPASPTPHGPPARRAPSGAAGRPLLTGAVLALLLSAAVRAEPPPQDGFFATPTLGWRDGEQRLDIGLESRFRTEWWDAHRGSTDAFHALRTRVSVQYSYGDVVTLFGQLQDARIYGLDSSTSGAGGLYRMFNDPPLSGTDGTKLRQLWARVQPIEGLAIQGGRQDIKLGTQALYPEANWKYLKIHRTSQRLVGGVGWTHGERSNDAVGIEWEPEGHHVYAFIANPTTGVFDIDNSYRRQSDILYGGLSWTAKRDTWLPNTELRTFFLGYDDDRTIAKGGLPDGVTIFTLGYSLIGVYPVGPGNFDLLFWGAGQLGEYNDVDHVAGALLFEGGYQFTDVFASPWFRTGINVASGGDSDGDHNTFFNMLPTNHLYYGFADQLAFQNLIDWFAQILLKPHDRVTINLMLHRFWLADTHDGQYFGSGAFTKRGNFGFGMNPSGGRSDIGTELDTVVDVTVCKGVALQGGYAKLWGGDVMQGNFANEDVDFGYMQVTFKY